MLFRGKCFASYESLYTKTYKNVYKTYKSLYNTYKNLYKTFKNLYKTYKNLSDRVQTHRGQAGSALTDKVWTGPFQTHRVQTESVQTDAVKTDRQAPEGQAPDRWGPDSPAKPDTSEQSLLDVLLEGHAA